MKPYEIISTGKDCGLIEFISDALSLDYLKRKIYQRCGSTELKTYFIMNFGKEGSKDFV
jgi:phosphatidylinositol kinase/protein kinase (PI-3  family)